MVTLAILTCAEVRAAEQRAVEAGISLQALMRKAGQACADVLHAEFPEGRVVVLAGPGNNGGDAFVAAQRLVDLGRHVSLYELAPRANARPKARKQPNAGPASTRHSKTFASTPTTSCSMACSAPGCRVRSKARRFSPPNR